MSQEFVLATAKALPFGRSLAKKWGGRPLQTARDVLVTLLEEDWVQDLSVGELIRVADKAFEAYAKRFNEMQEYKKFMIYMRERLARASHEICTAEIHQWPAVFRRWALEVEALKTPGEDDDT